MIKRLSLIATILTFIVVVLGAWVRLSDAGLGCPDWPGCYGQVIVPQTEAEHANANAAYPERPLEVGKAWKEMIHRYVAGSLIILGLAIVIVAHKTGQARSSTGKLAAGILALLFVQAAMGALTVVWKVPPLIVTGHLILGLATLSLFLLLYLQQGRLQLKLPKSVRSYALFATFVLIAQIFLGGWTSTNYAALACTDFPTCQGTYLPETDFADAFKPWRGLGQNYEFGVLDSVSRVTIHYTHRIGAVVTTVVMLGLIFMLLRSSAVKYALALSALLVLQVALGIGNVLFNLEILAVAVAHNGVAALLLMLLVTLNFGSRRRIAAAQV